MKKSLRFVIAALALLCSNNINAQYQLANNGFEDWEPVSCKKVIGTANGDEPLNWSSFIDATGSMQKTGVGVQLYKETTNVHSGKACAKLTARSVMGVIAQGNLTNGCVNMGSATATDAKSNYNYINESREDQSMKFSGRPDAVKIWVNFSGSTKANVEVILTTKGYYQSPEANTLTAKKVAHAQNKTIASNGTWTELTIPFTYSTNDTPYYSLVNISTSAEPGKGAASDVLYVDDIIMVYNSELSEASYDGAKLDFTTSMFVDAKYDESKLQLASNGKGATIEKAYDEESALLTITVKGDNISEDASNCHTYTIQFKKEASIPVIATREYTEDLYVSVNGVENAPQKDVTVTMETLQNGNINFILKDFILFTEEAILPVGNIELNNIEKVGDKYVFEGTQTIKPGSNFVELDGEIYPMEPEDWTGPIMGEMNMTMTCTATDSHLYVTLNISLVGQDVEVHLGYDSANMTITDAKYATFVTPFAVPVPQGVTFYRCFAVKPDRELLLQKQTAPNIPANTPVILYSENPVSQTFFGVAQNTSPVKVGIFTGVYSDTPAPKGSYVLQNIDGVTGFYKVVDAIPTVKANRCYITLPTSSSAKMLSFTTEEETAINAINALTSGKIETIYNASGVRQSSLQKGMNIIKMSDGSIQKILVK